MMTTVDSRGSPGHAVRPDGGGRDPRRWRALSVCLVAGFMTLLDVSIVNVALPSIQQGTAATDSDLQWIVSGYALTFGLVLVPAGRLGDAGRRRTMFVLGVVVFSVSSLAAGLAPNALALVVARLVQGVGGGLLNPQVSGLVQEQFRGAERAKAFGLLGATIGVSTAVGPVVGGLVIGALGADEGWRWIFFINVPIGLAAIALSYRYIAAPGRGERPAAARDRRAPRTRDLDPVGVLLLAATVLAVLLPLVQERQWEGTAKWWLLACGLPLGALFALWEWRHARRGGEPVVDLRLFAVERYSSGAVIATIYFAGFTSVFFVLTLYLQQGLGYSALLAGLAVTPFAAASGIGSVVGGRLVSRHGRVVVVAGLVLVIVGLVVTDAAVTLVDGWSVGWWMSAPLLVAGLGSGLVISPNVALTLSQVPVARAGTAGGVLQTGQRMGTAGGIALVGAVYFASLADGAARAAALGLRVAVLITAVALLLAVLDLWAPRRRRPA